MGAVTVVVGGVIIADGGKKRITIAGDIVSQRIIDITVVVIVDIVAGDFIGVFPQFPLQFGMEQVNPAVYDSHDHLGVVCRSVSIVIGHSNVVAGGPAF